MAKYLKINGKVCLDTWRGMLTPEKESTLSIDHDILLFDGDANLTQTVKVADGGIDVVRTGGTEVHPHLHQVAAMEHYSEVVPAAQLLEHLHQRRFIEVEEPLYPLGYPIGVNVMNLNGTL